MMTGSEIDSRNSSSVSCFRRSMKGWFVVARYIFFITVLIIMPFSVDGTASATSTSTAMPSHAIPSDQKQQLHSSICSNLDSNNPNKNCVPVGNQDDKTNNNDHKGIVIGDDLLSLTLQEKWQTSPNSWLLRFSLPSTHEYLFSSTSNDNVNSLLSMPTCISVHYNSTTSKKTIQQNKEIVLVKKSYSPISHPSTKGYLDLLVKAYDPPQQSRLPSSDDDNNNESSDGVGSYICSLQTGQTMVAALKKQRMIHGSPHILGRGWTHIGLVAGGTGIAPLLQLVRIFLLGDPHIKLYLLSINRKQEDILMKDELDQLVKDYPNQFKVTYSLTDPTIVNNNNNKNSSDQRTPWKGTTGRGSVEIIRKALPPPSKGEDHDRSSSTMIFVCGTDGFVETWGGPVIRGPPLANGKKGPKIQGPLLGLLKEAGYSESQVFKY